jgi:hypothetical protein
MPRTIVTEEMLADWVQHPVTDEILRALKVRRQSLHNRWERGDFTYPTSEAMALLNAKALGQLEEIVWLLEIDLDKLKGELEDE